MEASDGLPSRRAGRGSLTRCARDQCLCVDPESDLEDRMPLSFRF